MQYPGKDEYELYESEKEARRHKSRRVEHSHQWDGAKTADETIKRHTIDRLKRPDRPKTVDLARTYADLFLSAAMPFQEISNKNKKAKKA